MEHMNIDDIQKRIGEIMGQFKIAKAGLMTTVQDLGRYGYQQYGVSVSGAMDQVAAKLANILVGNDENEGLLEATMIGPEMEFLQPTAIAITGGDLQAHINNKPISLNKSIAVNSGDYLSFKGVKKGCRTYIGFAGGIDVPIVMGSKSTFLRAQMGGYEGRALKAGDIVNTGIRLSDFSEWQLPEDFYDYGGETVEVRVVLGPQDDAFTEEGINTLFNSVYGVSNNCDRMGYTLEGNVIQHKYKADIISDGIAMGAIQVPSKGNPIIMMADRQTTGGYTKIGNVITADLPKIAQSKPGDKIIFIKSSLQEAHTLIKELDEKIEAAKKQFINHTHIKSDIISTRNFMLRINEKVYDVKVEELK